VIADTANNLKLISFKNESASTIITQISVICKSIVNLHVSTYLMPSLYHQKHIENVFLKIERISAIERLTTEDLGRWRLISFGLSRSRKSITIFSRLRFSRFDGNWQQVWSLINELEDGCELFSAPRYQTTASHNLYFLFYLCRLFVYLAYDSSYERWFTLIDNETAAEW